MQIARVPLMPCRVMTLPFEEKPAPAKADLKPTWERKAAC